MCQFSEIYVLIIVWGSWTREGGLRVSGGTHNDKWLFIRLCHTKSGGVLCYTLRMFECPSVSASFPDSNLCSFWPIFFKLCMDIDIREEWFGIANELNTFINNRVMTLDWCKNVFFLSIFRTNWWILIKFCQCPCCILCTLFFVNF